MNWASQLVFLVMFAAVSEILLPPGHIRRDVKMVVGLVVVIAVISPLVALVKGSDWLEPLFYMELPAAAAGDEAVADGIALREKALAQEVDAQSEQVAGDTESFLLLLTELESAQVDLSGVAPVVKVQVSEGADWEKVSAKVRLLAAKCLGADPAAVQVRATDGR